MKKSRKSFWIIEILLFVLLIWIFGMIWSGSKPGRKKRVVCVVNDSTAQQWSDLYEGMQLSARQHGIEFVMADTEKLRDAADVRDVIADEATDGIDALIVEQIGMDAKDILPETLGKKVPKVYLNGSGATDAKNVNISLRTEWMMEKIVQEMKKDASNDLSGRTAGMLISEGSNPYFSSCQKTMTSILKKEGIGLSWTVRTAENAADTEKKLKAQERTDYMFAFDDNALAVAADCAEKAVLPGTVVYGIGNAEASIGYLDSGTIKGLLVPDTFLMGYQAMEDSVRMLEHHGAGSDSKVGGRYFRQEDLFRSKSSQGYLFPRDQM